MTRSYEQYRRIFEAERAVRYDRLDAFENDIGWAVGHPLEDVARVLACPLKKNPPNWQHGRVIYAVACDYLDGHIDGTEATLLDIGTAKGFSALMLQWAVRDTGRRAQVVSVDVIDPKARVLRNTVVELEGEKTLAEILSPWPESQRIEFVRSTGRDWLVNHPQRVHLAYVDGKHTYDEVSWEAALLAQRQQSGDVIIFDDVQIEGVRDAVKELKTYDVEWIDVLPTRGYAIARKR